MIVHERFECFGNRQMRERFGMRSEHSDNQAARRTFRTVLRGMQVPTGFVNLVGECFEFETVTDWCNFGKMGINRFRFHGKRLLELDLQHPESRMNDFACQEKIRLTSVYFE